MTSGTEIRNSDRPTSRNASPLLLSPASSEYVTTTTCGSNGSTYAGSAAASAAHAAAAAAARAARSRRGRHSSINLDNLDGPQETMSPSDFKFLGVIGKGSFGQVLLARHIASGKAYAVKMLSKRVISRRKETQHVLSERSVLIKVLHHPYLVQLHYAFTTRHKIFFVLDFVNGGELFYHLQRERVFVEPRAMFYAAEICCALTYMHTKGIVYRDLKPENLLLDREGHVVLTDFGLCKEGLQNSSCRTGTFCGTPEYLAPEILLKKPYTRVVDWWTLGAVLYEMLYGLPPFYSTNQMVMYEAIVSKPLKLKNSASARARNLLTGLLKKAPEERLGGGPEDGEAIKGHEFFRAVDWALVEQRKMRPPFVPRVTSDTDTRNIDPSFTREPVQLGSIGSPAPELRASAKLADVNINNNFNNKNNPFKGFSYARPDLESEVIDR
ncbi:serine/threonine-protein kinase Sgk2 [Hyalella azteca]|uniref:Serine/threonine-protein kinase Sgk2 n=1 Tax=Hyalella azteca TaxID=294128 RepID=A0A8B7NUR0_HYAAZ|nr:serine/threonine-protein kinase Sgk2 [Hyalella azteca]